MGIMNFLGLGSDIAKPIEAVSDLYTTDKARIEAEANYETVAQKPRLGQLSNNAIMAASTHFFNSGWQSLIGWTSGFLILFYYLPQIMIITYVWAIQCLATNIIYPFPMKPDDLLNLVYLLFGFGVHSILQSKINT